VENAIEPLRPELSFYVTGRVIHLSNNWSTVLKVTFEVLEQPLNRNSWRDAREVFLGAFRLRAFAQQAVHGNLVPAPKTLKFAKLRSGQNIFQLAYSPRKAAMRAAPFGCRGPCTRPSLYPRIISIASRSDVVKGGFDFSGIQQRIDVAHICPQRLVDECQQPGPQGSNRACAAIIVC